MLHRLESKLRKRQTNKGKKTKKQKKTAAPAGGTSSPNQGDATQQQQPSESEQLWMKEFEGLVLKSHADMSVEVAGLTQARQNALVHFTDGSCGIVVRINPTSVTVALLETGEHFGTTNPSERRSSTEVVVKAKSLQPFRFPFSPELLGRAWSPVGTPMYVCPCSFFIVLLAVWRYRYSVVAWLVGWHFDSFVRSVVLLLRLFVVRERVVVRCLFSDPRCCCHCYTHSWADSRRPSSTTTTTTMQLRWNHAWPQLRQPIRSVTHTRMLFLSAVPLHCNCASAPLHRRPCTVPCGSCEPLL